MNKAFVREPDMMADFCPRCGSRGEPVGGDTLRAYLTDPQRRRIAESANFCPSTRCEVVYFDSFERVILATELDRAVYPKDPDAPICACLGLTWDDIEREVREGKVARARAAIEHARSPEAQCSHRAANGRSCEAYVQKCYRECLARKGQPPPG